MAPKLLELGLAMSTSVPDTFSEPRFLTPFPSLDPERASEKGTAGTGRQA